MSFFALFVPLMAALHAPVAQEIPHPGFTAGRTYCAMRNNGASHQDAFNAAYTITHAGKTKWTKDQSDQMNIFALVVLNECNRYKRDFERY